MVVNNKVSEAALFYFSTVLEFWLFKSLNLSTYFVSSLLEQSFRGRMNVYICTIKSLALFLSNHLQKVITMLNRKILFVTPCMYLKRCYVWWLVTPLDSTLEFCLPFPFLLFSVFFLFLIFSYLFHFKELISGFEGNIWLPAKYSTFSRF